MRVLLLPGMDGTGALFSPLLSHLAHALEPEVVRYPTQEPLGYRALLERLPVPSEPFIVVAESFSGPLALQLASTRPAGLRAVVLVASFISSPLPQPLAWLARAAGGAPFRRAPPSWVVRRFLAGADAPAELVEAVRHAIAMVSPSVMAKRLEEILRVDASELLRTCGVPVTYVRATGDRLVPASTARRMGTLRPSMACVDVEAPHLVLQRRPVECAAMIQRVVERASLNRP